MSSLPGQTVPANNIVDVISNIQAWGTGIFILLLLTAISTAILAGVAVGDLVQRRKVTK